MYAYTTYRIVQPLAIGNELVLGDDPTFGRQLDDDVRVVNTIVAPHISRPMG